jgi:hypothetical protein
VKGQRHRSGGIENGEVREVNKSLPRAEFLAPTRRKRTGESDLAIRGSGLETLERSYNSAPPALV